MKLWRSDLAFLQRIAIWGSPFLLSRGGGYVLIALGLTHATIAAVTIVLHRHQAHRALSLHPVVSHSFRVWLRLSTGMVAKESVAIHRKHHANAPMPF